MERRSDKEIISLILERNDLQLYGVLYRRHSLKVFEQCYYYIKDEHLAEDFTHDIFLKVFDKLEQFANNSSFKTWLSSVTRNFCLDYKRRNRRKRVFLVEDFFDSTHPALITETIAFEADEQAILQKKVLRIISKFSKEERELLKMKYFEDKSIEEIRVNMNLSTQSATKMRLKRTRDKVKKQYLSSRGVPVK